MGSRCAAWAAPARSSCWRWRCSSALGVNVLVRWLRQHGRPRLGLVACALAVLVIIVNLPAVWNGTFYGKNLERPETTPDATGRTRSPRSNAKSAQHADPRAARRRLLVVPVGQHGRARSRRASPTGRTSPASSSRTGRRRRPTCSTRSTASSSSACRRPAGVAPIARADGHRRRRAAQRPPGRALRPRATEEHLAPVQPDADWPQRTDLLRHEPRASTGVLAPRRRRRSRCRPTCRTRRRSSTFPSSRRCRSCTPTATGPRSSCPATGTGWSTWRPTGSSRGTSSSSTRRRSRTTRRACRRRSRATACSSSPTRTASAPSAGTTSTTTSATPAAR